MATGSLYANRASYDLKSLSFEGLQPEANSGDVPGDAVVVLTMDVVESGITPLREYIAREDHGFKGSVQFGEYSFDFAVARLTEPLSTEYNPSRNLHLVFQTKRSCITNLIRPIGKAAVDPSAFWYDALYAYSQQKDHLRRKRIELGHYEADVVQRGKMLAEADQALADRRAKLWQGATPEMIADAEARGSWTMTAPNTFRCSLPQTTSYQVLEISSTTVFATPNIVVTVLDPDGSLRIGLSLVPAHIAEVSFEVADDRKGFRYRAATLLMVEMAVGDAAVTMMWSASAADVWSIPVFEPVATAA